MKLISYNSQDVYTDEYSSPKLALEAFRSDMVNWLDLSISDLGVVNEIGERIGLHHMVLEDVCKVEHLPTVEVFDQYVFFSLKMFMLKEGETSKEHLSFVLGDNLLLTLQEEPTQDVFTPVRDRIFNNLGRIRLHGSDYLFYRLIDSVVDNYLLVLEDFRNRIEDLEEDILANKSRNIIAEALDIKKELSRIRKYTAPLKEVLGKLISDPNKFIKPETITYLRDVYDQLNYLTATFDTFREMIKDLVDMHVAIMGHNTNAVMKTLTIVATIFIPLTFIVGVYGMNFHSNFPELDWEYGYPAVWALMIVLSIVMIVFMKRKRWF